MYRRRRGPEVRLWEVGRHGDFTPVVGHVIIASYLARGRRRQLSCPGCDSCAPVFISHYRSLFIASTDASRREGRLHPLTGVSGGYRLAWPAVTATIMTWQDSAWKSLCPRMVASGKLSPQGRGTPGSDPVLKGESVPQTVLEDLVRIDPQGQESGTSHAQAGYIRYKMAFFSN